MGKSQDAVVVVVLKILQASCVSFELLSLLGLSGMGVGKFCMLSVKALGTQPVASCQIPTQRVPSAHVQLLWCPGAEMLGDGCAQVVSGGASGR